MGRTFAYIGAGLLFLFGLCLVAYGALALLGSTNPSTGNPNWVAQGLGFSCFGLILLAGGGG